MFKALATIAVLSASVSAFAGVGPLDGSKYCRQVRTDGTFGQPAGIRRHCLSFESGRVTDNANTFFGNPPEETPYTLKGNTVSFDGGKYQLSKDLQTLKVTKEGSAVKGTVFTLEADVRAR